VYCDDDIPEIKVKTWGFIKATNWEWISGAKKEDISLSANKRWG
jgi:hypothetical protein